jgi:hypothetical protein
MKVSHRPAAVSDVRGRLSPLAVLRKQSASPQRIAESEPLEEFDQRWGPADVRLLANVQATGHGHELTVATVGFLAPRAANLVAPKLSIGA